MKTFQPEKLLRISSYRYTRTLGRQVDHARTASSTLRNVLGSKLAPVRSRSLVASPDSAAAYSGATPLFRPLRTASTVDSGAALSPNITGLCCNLLLLHGKTAAFMHGKTAAFMRGNPLAPVFNLQRRLGSPVVQRMREVHQFIVPRTNIH